MSGRQQLERILEIDRQIRAGKYPNVTFAASPVVTVKEELLLHLDRAIRERLRVRMEYYTASRDVQQTRVVEPYHLYNLRGDWYLIAFDHLRHAMRTFHAGRVGWREILPEKFRRDLNFSVERWMAQRSGWPMEIGRGWGT